MLNEAGVLYFGSRVVAAAGNLAAVIVFTRLAGRAEYGHYLLIFAWSLIAYGFGAQWMKIAYFAVFHPSRLNEYVGSLKRLVVAGLAFVALALGAVGILGFSEPRFLIAVFAMVCGITVYEAAFEVARTLLEARAGALSMLLRTVLTLALGCVSLKLGGGAWGLAMAIALAHAVAALPSLFASGGLHLASGSRAASLHILRYGWPLFLSFGVNAVGSSIDRLLIAHYVSTSALGSYGVVADLLRQTFIVFGDAIILSLVTLAKKHANAGDLVAANETLRKAFNACLFASSLGAAFFIVFGEPVLRMILKPEFIQPVHGLIPFLAVAFGLLTMRTYYFAQAIFFSQASHVELYYALLFLAVSGSLSAVLIPGYGLNGAAYAFLGAGVFSLIAAALLGRRLYRLPVDPVGLGIMPTLAVLLVFGAHLVSQTVPGSTLPLLLDGLVFALSGAYVVRRFGLLSTAPQSEIAHGMQAS